MPQDPIEVTQIKLAAKAAMAYTAFRLHYETTRQPGWSDAETHWKKNEHARQLWAMLIEGVLQGAATAARMQAGQPVPGAPLPGLGAPLGPVSAVPRPVDPAAVDMAKAEAAALASLPPTGAPITGRQSMADPLRSLPSKRADYPFPDDPRPDPKADPQGYRRWKVRNFGRIYGRPLTPDDYADINPDNEPLPISPYLDEIPPESQTDD